MNDKNKNIESNKSNAPSNVGISLLAAAVSATLRLVVPVLGLFFLGLVIDSLLNQTAFWAIVGTILGFIIAVILIILQVKGIQEKERNSLKISVKNSQVNNEKSNNSRKMERK